MKAYVDGGLAKDAVKKCNARYQMNLFDNSNKNIIFKFWVNLLPDD